MSAKQRKAGEKVETKPLDNAWFAEKGKKEMAQELWEDVGSRQVGEF